MKTRTYYYRGEIEHCSTSPRFPAFGLQVTGRWLRGYSANGPTGGVLFPWMGKRACQSEAKRDGLKAVFMEEPK